MSAKKYLLGIDIGTYSAKGVLVHPNGTVRASHTVEYELSIPKPGWAEHDADAIWWNSFKQIAQKLCASDGVDPKEVAGVGCSAIGITMLPVDVQGYPLRASVLYGIDTRAHREVKELTELFGSDEIVTHSGSPLSANSVGPKILWFRKNEPELFERTHKVLTASSYLCLKLTGNFIIDSYSAQGFAPLFDVDNQRWNPAMAEPICPLELLPTLHGATDIVGTVTEIAAAETGLAPGTPVIAGTVDAAAEAISIGATADGETMLMLGTTAFITQILNERRQHSGLWSARFLVPNTFALSAGMATSAALTRWFKDNFGHSEKTAEDSGGTNAYQALAEQASEVPVGSSGLVVLPYFSGERAPINDVRARGLILGLTLSHSRGHLYRALLEGVAYAIRHNLEVMDSIGASPRRLIAVGGGTKNALWLQIIADCIGRPLFVPATTIGASFGDAYLAGVGVGVFDDFDTLSNQWIVSDKIVEPDLENHEIYSRYFDVYLRSYEKLKDEMHVLADLPTPPPASSTAGEGF
ncbi:MAG: FGGY-family carbohydrate kinase [Trueperaceae bacterium]